MQQLKELKKKESGFTIIEVMIVLVIAAVIILIVFLAVPALQRNSRNNQRKNDVSRISAAITEAANNNNGTLPANYSDVSPLTGNLGFYSYPTGAHPTGAATNTVNGNTFVIRTSATCSGADAIAGSSRQFAVLYAVETSGSNVSLQCLAG